MGLFEAILFILAFFVIGSIGAFGIYGGEILTVSAAIIIFFIVLIIIAFRKGIGEFYEKSVI